jgi:cardiolipin synthase (CMP-forming)
MWPASDAVSGRAVRHVPNVITVVRGVLIPVIGALLVEQRYVAAFWTLLASALSDLVDGQIARHFNARTRFGAIADPVADKLTMLTVTLVLAWQGLLPLWLAAAIVLRDIVIVSGAVAYHRLIGPVELSPTWLSKLNTALEFTVLAAVLADAAGLFAFGAQLPVLFALALATVVASGAQYVWIWGRRAVSLRRAPHTGQG